MMTKTDNKQHEIVAVLMEDLVPQNHILRKIDKVLDLNFVYGYVEHLIVKQVDLVLILWF